MDCKSLTRVWITLSLYKVMVYSYSPKWDKTRCPEDILEIERLNSLVGEECVCFRIMIHCALRLIHMQLTGVLHRPNICKKCVCYYCIEIYIHSVLYIQNIATCMR